MVRAVVNSTYGRMQTIHTGLRKYTQSRFVGCNMCVSAKIHIHTHAHTHTHTQRRHSGQVAELNIQGPKAGGGGGKVFFALQFYGGPQRLHMHRVWNIVLHHCMHTHTHTHTHNTNYRSTNTQPNTHAPSQTRVLLRGLRVHTQRHTTMRVCAHTQQSQDKTLNG